MKYIDRIREITMTDYKDKPTKWDMECIIENLLFYIEDLEEKIKDAENNDDDIDPYELYGVSRKDFY